MTENISTIETFMLRSILITAGLVFMVGCSSHQAKELGLGGGQVNGYAQNMTNDQLCSIYLKERTSNQTRAAIASEWSRRKLSRAYCKEKANEWYLTEFAKWLTLQESEKK
ncbi:hypothetical protein L4D04_12825 [Photobacterium angustum]|nr:hypothetical protein [Photobacterium angustum]